MIISQLTASYLKISFAIMIIGDGVTLILFGEIYNLLSKKNLIFDEWGATNIRKYLNIKETSQYDWLYRKVLDVTPPDIKKRHSPMFIRFCNYPIIAKYENGHIFAYSISPSGIENTQEYAYCHLQKRKINIITQQLDSFLLYNEMFLPLQMFQECIYNTQNSILKQYQHNIVMSKQIG